MVLIQDAYLDAASSAASLLADPAVAAAWERPSALAEFSVSGLAGHLAQQILNVPPTLAKERADEPPITLLDHYARAAWVDAGINDEINVGIRQRGEEIAGGGAAELVERVNAAVARLRETLPGQPADRPVHLAWTGWSLRLEDFLMTRMMELAVHSDDLAFSVGVATPQLPPHVLDPVLGLLTALSTRRHGQEAVLRALTRAERAPASIAAF